MIPHLKTALTGALGELEQHFIDALPAIERWFRLEWMEQNPPVYSSVDLRNASFKIAPIDTNLFPGGWNNISEQTMPLASQAAMVTIDKYCPEAKRILIVPENHTRNGHYFDNVLRLVEIFSELGIETRVGTINPQITQPQEFTSASGKKILLEPVIRTSYRLKLANFDPCAIIINNDLSAGLPTLLTGLFEQQVLPPLHAGWYVRRKSEHAHHYDRVAKKFANLMQIDPWLINPLFRVSNEVDFGNGSSLSDAQDKVSDLFAVIRRKYKEYSIQQTPYVVAKADNGTYGMGIMIIKDAQELANINRRVRNKMQVVKDGQQVTSLILQEGVPTIETVRQQVAEPVIYMFDRFVVGAFYRANGLRSAEENLNATGAHFVPMHYEESFIAAAQQNEILATPNRFYMYGVVARLAMLAAAYELEATEPEPLNYTI